MAEREFSRKCGKCRERAVALAAVDYTLQIDHDGRKYTVSIPSLVVPRCGNCGTIALDEEADRRISAAFRSQVGLLAPDEIRRQRKALGLKQKDLAERLGVAEATLSRWETGAQIQQRSLDNLLRLFFALPEVRRALAPSGDPTAAAFRCLQETAELRRRARLFRLTEANRINVSETKEESEANAAEPLAGS